MTQDSNQRKIAARELANHMWVNSGGTAIMNLDDLSSAIGSIDDTMDILPSGLNQVQTIKTNFVQRLPEPFKSQSNANQKAIALMVWAMKEVGII